MESLIGEDSFRDFLRFWISTNSLTSVTNIQVRSTWEYFVSTHLSGKSGDQINDILMKVDWETWIYEPTFAPVGLDFTTPESE